MFSYLLQKLCISLYSYNKLKGPTHPPLLLMIHSSLYFQTFQSVVLRFQKSVTIEEVQAVIFSVCHPYLSILFLHSCSVLSLAPQLKGYHKDTTKKPEASEGTEREISNGGSSARHRCQSFPTTAWGRKAHSIPWLQEQDIILPTTKIYKDSLILAHIV